MPGRDDGHLRHALSGLLPLRETACGHGQVVAVARIDWARLVLKQRNQPARIAVRQRLEQDAANDSEYGDVCTNTDRHDENGHDRKSGAPAQRPESDPKIPHALFHTVPTPCCAGLIAQQQWITKCAQCADASFFSPHAAGEVVCNLAIDMVAQLFVELRIQAVAMKQRTHPQGNLYTQCSSRTSHLGQPHHAGDGRGDTLPVGCFSFELPPS